MMHNFTDPEALKLKRIKGIHIEWAKCLLRIRNEAQSV